MANIPVIPGVSVATKGILNKPIKDIICALLFGGINNMLKGPLLCVNLDIEKLLEENIDGFPNLADLKQELGLLKDELKAAVELSGIPETLARVNAAIADVQSLLALNGLCAIPLKAPQIPDVISQVIDAEFREMNAILNDLGRLAKPSMCLDAGGGFGLASGYNPDSILGSIQKHGGKMANIPGNQIDALTKRLKGVNKALKKSVNRQLFPDFRHKHDLTTGQPYKKKTSASDPTPGPTLAGTPAVQWNPPYPEPDAPNLKTATATAQTLVASMKQTSSYPIRADGITSANPYLAMLGPEVYSLAVTAMTPQDPFFAQQDPVYDYCGKLVGYTSTVITGDATAIGGDPLVDAVTEPVPTAFEFLWLQERNCWAVTGVESEQLGFGRDVGRKGTYLTANPTLELRRSYVHTFGIPSMTKLPNNTFELLEEEFFICKVDSDLKPRKLPNGTLDLFNLGLARLETYELLEDANGSVDTAYATQRKAAFPTGTTIYFAAEQPVYLGANEPDSPNEATWWTDVNDGVIECKTRRFTLNRNSAGEVIDGTGTWSEVSESDREYAWFGSSNTFGDPHVDYLAYSTADGSVFGLLKFV